MIHQSWLLFYQRFRCCPFLSLLFCLDLLGLVLWLSQSCALSIWTVSSIVVGYWSCLNEHQAVANHKKSNSWLILQHRVHVNFYSLSVHQKILCNNSTKVTCNEHKINNKIIKNSHRNLKILYNRTYNLPDLKQILLDPNSHQKFNQGYPGYKYLFLVSIISLESLLLGVFLARINDLKLFDITIKWKYGNPG